MFTNPRSLYFAVLLLYGASTLHAQILPASDTVFFRNVKVGFSRDAFLRIEAASNVNVLDIRITPRLAVPGEFVLVTPTQLSFSMAKGARNNFLLRCIPQIGGRRSAALTIYTDQGDTTIELIGEVAKTQPDIITEPDTIDFGVIAPGEMREIPYLIYGAGIDSIEMDIFAENDHGPSLYFEVYATDPAVTFPHRMGPSDTLHMMARFTGYPPVGKKTGRSIMSGEVSGNVDCEFLGVVGKPELQFSPQLLDLGIVPLGATVDTFIYLRSIGEGAVTVESITPPPSYTISNIPGLPHDIDQADSLRLDVRFVASSPGVFEQALEVMAKATASGGKFRSALLKAIVLPKQLLAKSPDVLEVPCAISAEYQFTALQLTDTANTPISISRIVSDNPNIVIIDSALFPTTLDPGQSISITLGYLHQSGSASDSAIIEIYSGNYVLLRDTVRTRSIEQFVDLGVKVAGNTLDVITRNDLSSYGLTSLILEIDLEHDDVASLVLDTIFLHPSLSSATLVANYDTAKGIYRLEITSLGPIALGAEDIIATIPLRHYYAKDSVTAVTASCIAPGFETGCLTFNPTAASISTPNDCVDGIMRRHLRGEQLITHISMSENPVVKASATLEYSLLLPSQLSLTIYDALGNVMLQDFWTTASGMGQRAVFPVVSLAGGRYTAWLRAQSGQLTEMVSIPFVLIR